MGFGSRKQDDRTAGRVARLERRVAELERALRAQEAEAAHPLEAPLAPTHGPRFRRRHDEEPLDEQAGARLVANQMLLSGADEARVAAYLGETLGIDDPAAVIASTRVGQS